MKVKLSITMDNKTLKMIDEHVKSQRFRNKSHAIEFAIRELLKENRIKVSKNSNSNNNNQSNNDTNHTTLINSNRKGAETYV